MIPNVNFMLVQKLYMIVLLDETNLFGIIGWSHKSPQSKQKYSACNQVKLETLLRLFYG